MLFCTSFACWLEPLLPTQKANEVVKPLQVTPAGDPEGTLVRRTTFVLSIPTLAPRGDDPNICAACTWGRTAVAAAT